jgi:hypothetical protein
MSRDVKSSLKLGILFAIYLLLYALIDITNRWRGELNISEIKVYILIFIIGASIIILSFFLISIKKTKHKLIKGTKLGLIFTIIFISCLAITEFPGMIEAHKNSIVNTLLNKIGVTGFLFGTGSAFFIAIPFYIEFEAKEFNKGTLHTAIQVSATIVTAIWGLMGVALTIVWSQNDWIGATATQIMQKNELPVYMGGLMLSLKCILSAFVYTLSLVFWIVKPSINRIKEIEKLDKDRVHIA